MEPYPRRCSSSSASLLHAISGKEDVANNGHMFLQVCIRVPSHRRREAPYNCDARLTDQVESESFCPPDHSQQTYQEHIGTPVSAPFALGLSRSSLTAVQEVPVLDAPSSNEIHAAPPIETVDLASTSREAISRDRPRASRVMLPRKSREAPAWTSPSENSTLTDVLLRDAVQSRWHAPVDLQAQGWHLLPDLVTPNIQGSVPLRHDMDSGLRLYDEAILPPPYTSA